MERKDSPRYRFGPYVLDRHERQLRLDGVPVSLTPKAFDTLVVLVEQSGRVVTKDHLLQQVWPNVTVEESTLAQNISTIRKALGENAADPQYIETVAKHGYRFVADVQPADG